MPMVRMASSGSGRDCTMLQTSKAGRKLSTSTALSLSLADALTYANNKGTGWSVPGIWELSLLKVLRKKAIILQLFLKKFGRKLIKVGVREWNIFINNFLRFFQIMEFVKRA